MSAVTTPKLDSSLRAKFAVLVSVCLLTACSGDGAGELTSGASTTTDGTTVGLTDGTPANVTDGTTAGTSAETTAGVTGGYTTGTLDGATAGESGGNTASTSDGAMAGETGGNTAGTSDGITAGSTDGATEGTTTVDIDSAPIVRAPADTQIRINESLELMGSVTLDGMTSNSVDIQWETLSGPGNANFTNSQLAVSEVSFDDVGTYELQLSASNGSGESLDTVQVIVTSDIVNQAPIVNAGSNESLNVDEVLNLIAQVEDDGLPNDTLTGQWAKLSGPGEVTFGELSAKNTTATFNATGVFVLQFSSDDGALSDNDTLQVTVSAATPAASSANNINAANIWQNVNASNGSKPQSRHEAGAVAFQNQLYLMGGRGQRQVNRYNPGNNRWENLGTPSMELSHFQPVAHNGKIYVVGPLDCCFPSESVIANIQIFNPATKLWSQGATLPLNRRRGSAGVVVYNNKIYIVGGSTNGHDGGMVNWFDEYNPANNQWKTLPNAPTKRDHFNAAMVGSKLIVAGGRQTDHPRTFANLVATVDIYNFATGKWTNGAPIPTKRAGAMAVSYGDEIIVIGGESDKGRAALKTVEAYNVKTNKWRSLNSLRTERHSGGAAIVGGAIHVVSGNTTTGGGNETQSHEKLNLN